jgi:phosphohistidine phosphatase
VTELHFLRHAHAGDRLTWQGPDEDRPLSDKGERQAERLGVFLAGVKFSPDVFITSPKVRAARTAEIVADHLGTTVTVDDRLAGEFDLAILEAVLVDSGNPARPVIVGHDPDFSELLALLSGAPNLTMRKGAFALVDVERPLAPGAGTLRWLVPPDLLKPER